MIFIAIKVVREREGGKVMLRMCLDGFLIEERTKKDIFLS